MVQVERLVTALPLRPVTAGDNEHATLSDDKGEVLAKSWLLKLNTNQAYAVFGELSPYIANRAICLRNHTDEQTHLILQSVQDRYTESHLLDALIENVLGRTNFELKKNVTADFYEASDLLELLEYCSNAPSVSYVTVCKYSEEDFNDLIEFDNSISGLTRTEYIQEMASSCTTFVARKEGKLAGVVFGVDERILALYAEGRSITDSLIHSLLKECKSETVTFISLADIWPGAKTSRRVHRRHTRIVPGCIDWSQVYILNAGLNLL